MIVLVAKYYLKQASDAETIIGNLKEMAEKVRADEPGCALYHVSRSTERDDLILLYEHYVDSDALQAHRETAHFKEYVEEKTIPLLERREREVYSLVLS